MHYKIPFLILIAAVVAAAGCGGSSTGPTPAPPVPALVYPEKALIHGEMFDSWDAATIEEAAEADLMVLPLEWCFSKETQGVLGQIRRLNPGVQIIGYRSVMSVNTLWPDTSYLRTNIPYVLDYYNAVYDDWAWTTAHDTLMIWKDLILLNPIKNGALNRDLIDKMVGLLDEYQAKSGGAIDGLLHDFFMSDPYINPNIRDGILGEIDFDGDGVPYADDPDEQDLFYQWQLEYAKAIREHLGPNFIQIGNGAPPQVDAELARYMNGIVYELYPNNPWGMTDRAGLLRLLDNQRSGYLSKAKGRTWSFCANERGNLNGNNMFCLLSSLLASCMYTDMQGKGVFTGWTLDVEPGAPLGPTTIEGKMDSILTVRRPFENGEVRISFYDTGRREEAVFDTAASRSR
ncbi:MAG TPA: hypothetical protein VII85_04590 [Candidatus Krumholzibacteriaceae bacterium]